MKKIDGRYLKELREEKGYSIRILADLIYVSKSALQRWEHSHIPENSEILDKLADIFDTTVEDMRQQSEAKYGNRESDEYTLEQLAEMKFSAKNLIWPIIFLTIISVVGMLLPFIR